MASRVAEPMSVLREAAVAMHEQFTELTAVGFTEAQAIKIVVGLALGGPKSEGQ